MPNLIAKPGPAKPGPTKPPPSLTGMRPQPPAAASPNLEVAPEGFPGTVPTTNGLRGRRPASREATVPPPPGDRSLHQAGGRGGPQAAGSADPPGRSARKLPEGNTQAQRLGCPGRVLTDLTVVWRRPCAATHWTNWVRLARREGRWGGGAEVFFKRPLPAARAVAPPPEVARRRLGSTAGPRMGPPPPRRWRQTPEGGRRRTPLATSPRRHGRGGAPAWTRRWGWRRGTRPSSC